MERFFQFSLKHEKKESQCRKDFVLQYYNPSWLKNKEVALAGWLKNAPELLINILN